ncbi:thiamine pyrophosphate-dependent dehydrogenase E1 component subunit alpha [Candidatus Pelagibacter sp.]|nr:thiamine pyrophosphate-dependent dehydrogenase E1 component subunit alpha [Candidatus Pelagibacter sp.]
MQFFRIVEESIASKYHENKMRCPVHLAIGQEAISAAFYEVVKKNDKTMSSHRAHLHFLAKGGSLNSMIAEIYGKKSGCSSGKGGSMHLIDLKVNFMGSTAIVGNTIPISAGLALASKIKKENSVTYIFFGDGAIEEGVFYETINFAIVKELPIIFVCENNFYSVYTSLLSRQPKNRKIFKMVEAMGIKSYKTDGNDVNKCYQIFANSKKYLEQKKKPVFLEFETYRHLEHCGPNNDDVLKYRNKKQIEYWKKKDPLLNYENQLIKKKYLNKKIILKIKKEIILKVNNAFNIAERDKFPKQANAYKGLYA